MLRSIGYSSYETLTVIGKGKKTEEINVKVWHSLLTWGRVDPENSKGVLRDPASLTPRSLCVSASITERTYVSHFILLSSYVSSNFFVLVLKMRKQE